MGAVDGVVRLETDHTFPTAFGKNCWTVQGCNAGREIRYGCAVGRPEHPPGQPAAHHPACKGGDTGVGGFGGAVDFLGFDNFVVSELLAHFQYGEERVTFSQGYFLPFADAGGFCTDGQRDRN